MGSCVGDDMQEIECFWCGAVMGVSIKVYRARIGMFMRRIKNERNAVVCGPDGFSINMFFVGLVVMMLLVMGGV
jgi:hypothetical protein